MSFPSQEITLQQVPARQTIFIEECPIEFLRDLGCLIFHLPNGPLQLILEGNGADNLLGSVLEAARQSDDQGEDEAEELQ